MWKLLAAGVLGGIVGGGTATAVLSGAFVSAERPAALLPRGSLECARVAACLPGLRAPVPAGRGAAPGAVVAGAPGARAPAPTADWPDLPSGIEELLQAGKPQAAVALLRQRAAGARESERADLLLEAARIEVFSGREDEAEAIVAGVPAAQGGVRERVEQVRGWIERARRAGRPAESH